jgi:glycosyltransferase involved in cell wall biosynthesis
LIERVVILNDFGSINGGAAQVAIASACGLARAGMQVDFFCGVGPVAPQLREAGVNVECLDQPDILTDPARLRAATRGIWNLQAAAALERMLKKCDRRATVVHIHGWTKSLSSSVFRVARARGLPAVLTLHDYFAACPNGGFFDYQRDEICTREGMSASCAFAHCDSRSFAQKVWRVARQGVSNVAARVPSDVQHVIYVSELSRRILKPYFGDDTQWHFVPNPVLVARAPRVRAGANRHFLFLGRLSAEKGAELFAAAATKAGVSARIAGDGERRGLIEQRWPAVTSLGWLSAEDAQRELGAARALVFPSRWYEVQGLVVHEALARGVPVLVARASAAADAIKDGETGLLFDAADVDSLAAAMDRMRDDEQVDAMSRRAYADYWSNPQALEAHCYELRRVYGALVGDTSDSRHDPAGASVNR